MDIQRKLELFQQSVDSIATHDDLDAAVRKAALAQAKAKIDRALADIDARVQAEIDEQLGG